MLIEVKVPVLSESISEGTLVSWHKKTGEYVRADEKLVDLETDKVVLEVVAPKDGVLCEIKKGDGVNVTSDETIAVIDTEAEATNDADIERATMAMPQVEQAVPESVADGHVAALAAGNHSSGNNSSIKLVSSTVKPQDKLQYLSPAVRKLVAEYAIDPRQIHGTGKDGRLTKSDVIGYIKGLSQQRQDGQTEYEIPVDIDETINEPIIETKVKSKVQPIDSDARPEKRVPMSRLRARVAERLKAAQNTAAILTTFNEVNMQPIVEMRIKYKEQFLKKHKVKLGFMSFFTKAVVEALKQFPVLNASVDDKDIVYHGYYDIGIAVGSPRGLVVPILRDVDWMSFADIETAIGSYAQKAQNGKLSMNELTGGTFSITNGGVYGSMLSTPILNPPQSAILGMHKIQPRPVVEHGEIVVRSMMYLALSYDHRIIDGHEAVLFLVAIKEALEDPARMLLDI